MILLLFLFLMIRRPPSTPLTDTLFPYTTLVRSKEALGIGAALIDAGVRILEVPFNSPDPLASIAAMQAEYGDRALIGGGTLLSVRAVEELHGAGGRIMVTPNTDMQVIARGAELGLDRKSTRLNSSH